MEQTKISIFQRPAWVAVFALTAAIAWGWAFPLIKVGFNAFSITTDMTGSKMFFAGIRFAVAGLIILSVARSNKRPFQTSTSRDWLFILTFALMNTTLHYFFFYVGMSHSEGSRAAILNSLSTFLVVLLACACFKSDKLTSRKMLGCAVGFCGVLALNLGGAESGQFTWLGDGADKGIFLSWPNFWAMITLTIYSATIAIFAAGYLCDWSRLWAEVWIPFTFLLSAAFFLVVLVWTNKIDFRIPKF